MKSILCFGDSNTWGFNPKNLSRRSFEERWTGILQKKLDSFGCGSFRVIEEGLCGRTTVFDDPIRYGRKGSDFFPVALESAVPDVVVLMLGTNDCKIRYGATSEAVGQGVEVLLNQAERYSPKSRLLLVSPIFLGENVEEKDSEFNARSVAVSKELREVYQRISEARNLDFFAASDFASPCEDDLQHLDAEGHKNFAAGIFEKLISFDTP